MMFRLIKLFLSTIIRKLCRPYYLLHCKISDYRCRLRVLYYKEIFAECGTGLKVYGDPIIYNPENIHVGNDFAIGNGAQISARGKVYIGNHVTMSRGSQITVGQLDLSKWIEEEGKVRSHVQPSVYIADGCWLCVNSIILPGVKIIGKGVVVAAGAVVTSDITEDYVVVGGVPAKIIKRINNK